MKQFAELYSTLDQTNKINTKVDLLCHYFERAPNDDKLWVIALFTDKRPKRKVKVSLLKKWASEQAGVAEWLFEESYSVVGDLAETISLILPPPTTTDSGSLSSWMQFIQSLGDQKEEARQSTVVEAWDSLDQLQRFIFIKLLSGGFRIEVSENLLLKALEKATGIEKATLSHRIMGNWTPDSTTFEQLILEKDNNEDLSRPYPFCLAYPIENTPAEDLADPGDWLAEWKWDGIRGQLIYREGQIFVWSRGEELVTDKYPEFETLQGNLPDGLVLDGEILAFKEGEPLPFGELQTRIGRKKVTKSILQKAPVIFKVYDVLEWENEDVRSMPFISRREKLEGLFKASTPSCLQLSDLVNFENWQELASWREASRKHYAEGLMLKKKDSPYHVGRKKGDWWKWKTDPFSVDGVLMYAQRGHGRRAGLYTDYTFGVWKGDHLVPFAKAYSGLTDEEFKKVDSFVRRNTKERFGPVRTVKPALVFEIGFEGIQKSGRHKSGVALRFPRMLRFREDKQPKDADKLDSLLKLVK